MRPRSCSSVLDCTAELATDRPVIVKVESTVIDIRSSTIDDPIFDSLSSHDVTNIVVIANTQAMADLNFMSVAYEFLSTE